MLGQLGTAYDALGEPRLAFAMLDSSRTIIPPTRYAARGTGERGRTAVLDGCVMQGLFSHTNDATRRTLVVNDYALVAAPGRVPVAHLFAKSGNRIAAIAEFDARLPPLQQVRDDSFVF